MTGRSWSLYWASRATTVFVLAWAAGLLVVLTTGLTVLELAFIGGKVPRYVPLWEAVPVTVAAVGAGALAPRMRSWETGGRPALHARAGVAAVTALVLPGLLPWLAHVVVLPSQTRWWDIVWNVVTLASVALVATAMGGRVVGPLVALGCYVATMVLQHWRPDLAHWVPLSGSPGNLEPHIVPAVLASGVAVATWSYTLGCSRWAARTWRNDTG
ncbi:hypothetical protein ACFP6A_02030 [Quadrisphaera sp. GCM10027208]|uniref:hypothetical protein n=1 Tax=Quadrisphaera sp. GCM10027208 TaxID=3273423 RepID=UPI00361BC318